MEFKQMTDFGMKAGEVLIKCPECKGFWGRKKWRMTKVGDKDAVVCPGCGANLVKGLKFEVLPIPEKKAVVVEAKAKKAPPATVVINEDGTKTYKEQLTVEVKAKAKAPPKSASASTE